MIQYQKTITVTVLERVILWQKNLKEQEQKPI